jgi:hypothetical protein
MLAIMIWYLSVPGKNKDWRCCICWKFDCSWRSCRARELFYYLKGGHVDYDEEHSKVCGHKRFGRIYDTGTGSEQLPWPFRYFFLHSHFLNCGSNWLQATTLCGMIKTRFTSLGTLPACRL